MNCSFTAYEETVKMKSQTGLPAVNSRNKESRLPVIHYF